MSPPLSAVPGFRESVLRARPSGTPKPSWTEADFEANARKRVGQHRRRWREIHGALDGATVEAALELGCGAGLDCALAVLDGIPRVVGIDQAPALHGDGERSALAARQVQAAIAVAGAQKNPQMDIRSMDATALEFDDGSLDVIWSRTALEHVQPLEPALRETARVLRRGGVAHHVIDPFFWLKGCHARGLTELPWAHARLDLDGYERFVAEAESSRRAARRTAYLRSLNRLTLDDWHATLDSIDEFEIVGWDEHHSPLAVDMLGRHPEVAATSLPEVAARDLTCSALTAVLRRR